MGSGGGRSRWVVLGLLCGACRVPAAPLRASWPPSDAEPHGSSSATTGPARLSGGTAGLPSRSGPEAGYEWKRFQLSLGAQLIAEVDTVLRVDSETLGRGTEIDLEDDFDVDDSLFLGRIDAGWRFAKRHALDFSAFRLAREGTRVIDRDIQIGDVVFPVDARVTSESEQTIIKLAYRYAFLHRPRGHLGASIGAHTVDWSTEWRAGALALEEHFDVLVPLPVIGLFGSYALTSKLYLEASSEFFGLEYEEYDGFLNNTRLALEHRTFRHVGFGVGLDYFRIDASVESESRRLSASAEYDYLGLVGYLRIF